MTRVCVVGWVAMLRGDDGEYRKASRVFHSKSAAQEFVRIAERDGRNAYLKEVTKVGLIQNQLQEK